MFRCVKAKDVLSLAGPRIDGAYVFATLHFPDRSYLAILFDCMIRDVFGRFSWRLVSATALRRGVSWRNFIL
jgi:hypothetical protein